MTVYYNYIKFKLIQKALVRMNKKLNPGVNWNDFMLKYMFTSMVRTKNWIHLASCNIISIFTKIITIYE